MSRRKSRPDTDPPRWAEALLRIWLDPRDRETVTGDLLEEYREVVAPARGSVRARIWYVRQAWSLITIARAHRCIANFLRRHSGLPSRLWILGGTAALAGVLRLLIRSHFGPPRVPLGPAFFILAALVVSASTAARCAATIGFWRATLFWGGLFAAAVAVRMTVDALVPADPEGFFLAQSRGVFSELAYPRRALLGVTLAAILIGSGLVGARRTRQVRAGTLAAMATGVFGFLMTMLVAALRSILGVGGGPHAIHPPVIGVVAVLALSVVLGTIGAMFGRGLSREEKRGAS